MTKIINPLFSFSASGRFGRFYSFVKRKKITILEKKPIPLDAKSQAQLSWRHMYQKAIALWNALSSEEKKDWESLARRRHMTGIAFFISQCLKPNPGIYLPLQGGTMQGEIDMASFVITGLPSPVSNTQAARKKYVDDLLVTTFLGLTDTPGAFVDQAGKYLKVNDLETALEFTSPPGGAQLVVAETEVYNGLSPTVWTVLDLSGTVGSNPALVLLKVNDAIDLNAVAFRKDGDIDDFYSASADSSAYGCALGHHDQPTNLVLLVATSNLGKVQWKCETERAGTIVSTIAYIK